MHLIDANVLITAKNQYYPMQRVPEFWTWLAHRAAAGVIKMPLEIVEEISGGADELAEWINEPDTYKALLLEEEADAGLVQTVLQQYAPDLNDAEVIKLGRDPFLIAYGLVSPADRVIVTIEASKPTCQRANKRIPDTCNGLGLNWCNSFQMLAQLNFTTGWQGAAAS